MKKSFKLFALAALLLQAAIFSAFAANPPSDFTYELSKDNTYIVITELKNDKAVYVIPESIEDFPVLQVKIRPQKACTITLPEGIEDVYIANCTGGMRIKINQSLAKLQHLKSLDLGGVDFIGTVNKTPLKLPELTELHLINVNLIDKSISVGKELRDLRLWNTNVEELIYEEGVTYIRRDTNYDGFKQTKYYNKNLKRVVLPSTLKKIALKAFIYCPSLSEVVVPDSLEKVEVGTDEVWNDFWGRLVTVSASKLEDIFDTTSLPLKTRVRLNQLFFSNN